jgi:hypothetical protein
MPPSSALPATDARLRIRLIKAHADGKIDEEDLKIGALVDDDAAGPSSSTAGRSDDDDEVQVVIPVRRKRRKHRSRPILPGEVISLDDDDDVDGGDGDDLVIVEEVIEKAPRFRKKRPRGSSSGVHTVDQSADGIEIL